MVRTTLTVLNSKVWLLYEFCVLVVDGVSEPVDFEASFNKQYVKQKLGNGLVRIWHDVQARISAYLLGSDLALYKFDEFLQILGIVHRFVLWRTHCNIDSRLYDSCSEICSMVIPMSSDNFLTISSLHFSHQHIHKESYKHYLLALSCLAIFNSAHNYSRSTEQIYVSSDSQKCTEICQYVPLLIKSQNSWTVHEDVHVFLYAYSVQLAEYI